MNRMKLGLGAFFALTMGMFLAIPAVSRAAAISFDDTAANDTITVTANDFELGFSVNGIPVQGGLNNPQSITVSEANGSLSFLGQWDGLNTPIDRTIYLIEAANSTAVSDILHYTVTTNAAAGFSTIEGTFTSDFENNLGTLPPGVSPNNVFVETGQPVSFSAAFLTGQILSDVDPPTVTPEPGSVVLASIALGVLGVGALRRRVQNA